MKPHPKTKTDPSRKTKKSDIIMEEKITREMLADGNMLRYLKTKFMNDRSQDNLISLLACLRDSIVFVPMNVTGRDDNETPEPLRYRPELLRGPDGGLYFPVFTQKESIPEAFENNFTWTPIEVVQCVRMAHAEGGLAGLVMDAFTEVLTMPMNIADIIEKIPSSLTDSEEI